MPHPSARPVVFAAFANEPTGGARYLRKLAEEARRVREALSAQAGGLCHVEIRYNVTAAEVFDVFAQYRDQVAVFHFGGHADSYRLLLQDSEGRARAVSGPGLAQFLGEQHGLRLVFLNGCSTHGHVEGLLRHHVDAVIATSREINDAVATNLAGRFYKALGTGANLGAAYREATGAILAESGGDLRALYWQGPVGPEGVLSGGHPWEMQTRPGTTSVEGWSLTEAAGNPLFGLPTLPRLDYPGRPFQYLNRFRRADARVFFGRGYEIRDLYHKVTDPHESPLILLYGQSGVGKSSLLDAGLVPRLEGRYEVRYLRRLRELGLSEMLKVALLPEGLGLPVSEGWRAKEQQLGKPLVVILDQIEEAFTRPNERLPGEFPEFLGELRKAFLDGGNRPQGKLILGFRKEWFPEIDKALEQHKLPRAGVFLNRLDARGVREAVHLSEAVRGHYGLSIGEGLPDVIARDLLADAGSAVAPTLQVLLSTMWDAARKESMSNPCLDEALYSHLRKHGLHLGDHLDRQLEQIRGRQPEVLASGLALDVLAFHTTELATAEQRTEAEVRAAYGHVWGAVQVFLQECKDHYLLADTSGDHPDAENSTRLAHDTLAPIVRAKYVKSDRPGQRARRILDNRKGGWKGGKAGTPLGGVDLKVVEQGQQGTRTWDDAEQRLVEASRKRRRGRRIHRFLLDVTAVALLVLTLIGGIVLFDRVLEYNTYVLRFTPLDYEGQRQEIQIERLFPLDQPPFRITTGLYRDELRRSTDADKQIQNGWVLSQFHYDNWDELRNKLKPVASARLQIRTSKDRSPIGNDIVDALLEDVYMANDRDPMLEGEDRLPPGATRTSAGASSELGGYMRASIGFRPDGDQEYLVLAGRAIPEVAHAIRRVLARTDTTTERRDRAEIVMRRLLPDGISPKELIRMTNKNHPAIRSTALRLIRAWPGREPRFTDVLVTVLNNPDSPDRTCAAEALGRLGDAKREVIEALVAAVRAKNPPVQAAAAEALGKLGQAKREVIHALVMAVRAKNPPVQTAAAKALGNLRQAEPEVTNALVLALSGREPTVQTAAAEALGNLGVAKPEVIKALIAAMSTGNLAVRTSAQDAISKLERVDREGVLHELLVTSEALDDSSRNLAVQGLGALGNGEPRIINLLERALRNDHSPAVQSSAAYALGEQGNRGKAQGMIIQALTDAINSTDSNVQLSAIVALGELGAVNSQVIGPLVDTLTQGAPHLHSAAAQALGEVKQPNDTVFEALVDVLRHQEVSKRQWAADRFVDLLRSGQLPVQSAAATALGKLGGNNREVRIALVGALKSDTVKVLVEQAIEEVGRHPDLLDIVEEAKRQDTAVKRSVVDALELLDTFDSTVIDALIEALKSEYPPVQHSAANALSKVKVPQPTVIAALIASLREPSFPPDDPVVKALVALGKNEKPGSTTVIDSLVSAVREEVNSVKELSAKRRAVTVLGELGRLGKLGNAEQKVICALVDVVKKQQAVQPALVSLGKIGNPEQKVIDTILGFTAAPPGDINVIHTRIQDSYIAVTFPSHIANEALRKLRTEDVGWDEQKLLGMLEDRLSVNRRAGAILLGARPDLSNATLSTIQRLRMNPQPWVRGAAFDTLVWIEYRKVNERLLGRVGIHLVVQGFGAQTLAPASGPIAVATQHVAPIGVMELNARALMLQAAKQHDGTRARKAEPHVSNP